MWDHSNNVPLVQAHYALHVDLRLRLFWVYLFLGFYKRGRNPLFAPLLDLNTDMTNVLGECAHNWWVDFDSVLEWVHELLSKMTNHFGA